MQNFKIIIHDCFLGVPTSPVKKNILTDSSHLLKKARDAIFIQKKVQDICWIILTLLFSVLDSILQYFQTVCSNSAFYLHIAIEMTSSPMEKSKLPP